jgi:excisionase family DNA binding protein
MQDEKKEQRGPRSYMTPHEFAAHLGVNVKTVYAAIKAGTTPSVRVGRTVRIPSTAARPKGDT